jgi:acyl-CoA synthetase (AMP-forming)/AMP-acid ligase II
VNTLFTRQPTAGTRLQPGFYSEIPLVRTGGSVDDVLLSGAYGELIASIDENDAAFVEYLGRSDATREKLENGCYRTSDAAVLLCGGDIEIRGPVDDMISDGENILPQQIEESC